MRRHQSVLGMVVIGLALAACHSVATPASARHVEAGSPFRMEVGETVWLPDDSRLRYVRVADDSRCPPKVQCIWAGEVVVELAWRAQHGAPTSFELHSMREPRSPPIGAWRVSLEAATPGAQPTIELALRDATRAP